MKAANMEIVFSPVLLYEVQMRTEGSVGGLSPSTGGSKCYFFIAIVKIFVEATWT